MAMPYNTYEMRRADYTELGESTCRHCGERTVRWLTTNGYSIAFNPVPDDRAEAVMHRITCGKPKPVALPTPAPQPQLISDSLLAETQRRVASMFRLKRSMKGGR